MRELAPARRAAVSRRTPNSVRKNCHYSPRWACTALLARIHDYDHRAEFRPSFHGSFDYTASVVGWRPVAIYHHSLAKIAFNCSYATFVVRSVRGAMEPGTIESGPAQQYLLL